MKLYFLRHAEAIDGADDAARPLSKRGKEQCCEVGEFLKNAEIKFDAAYSSPLVRARQTAERVLEVTQKGNNADFEITEALGLETREAEFMRWLSDIPDAKHVLLVGHAPSLARHVRHLIGIKHQQTFELPKGGLACLQTDDRQKASLKFFISPKVLG